MPFMQYSVHTRVVMILEFQTQYRSPEKYLLRQTIFHNGGKKNDKIERHILKNAYFLWFLALYFIAN